MANRALTAMGRSATRVPSAHGRDSATADRTDHLSKRERYHCTDVDVQSQHEIAVDPLHPLSDTTKILCQSVNFWFPLQSGGGKPYQSAENPICPPQNRLKSLPQPLLGQEFFPILPDIPILTL